MSVLPPGTLLQLMYLHERLALLKPGYFIEVGPGSGEITALLLSLGWRGVACDLDSYTVGKLRDRFARQVADRQLAPWAGDFLRMDEPPAKADLIISCMVMEHLDATLESQFMLHCARLLAPSGVIVGLVPASPAHWGIEDEIAGHYRRYTRAELHNLMQRTGWRLTHIAGLTFPISNFLFPISNWLVKRKEDAKLKLTQFERTKHSGRREVLFKTYFPSMFRFFLNPYLMRHFHVLQKRHSDDERAMVIYFEARPFDAG